MREYVESLLRDGFQEILSCYVGCPVTERQLAEVNWALRSYVGRLDGAGELPHGHRIEAVASFDYGLLDIRVLGLDDLMECLKVSLIEEPITNRPKVYGARIVDTNQVMGYCSEGPNEYGIAMVDFDSHMFSRHRPIPVVVAETVRFGNQMFEGYWVEEDNQSRETCFFCDSELKRMGKSVGGAWFDYKICEECDKR